MKFLIALFALFAAASAAINRVAVETDMPLQIPAGWTQGQRFTGNKPFTLNIAIKHQNVDEVRRIHKAVSDPKSPEYGNHLTLDELNKIWSPSEEAVTAVKVWLHKYGITNDQMKWNRGQEYVQVTIGSQLIEKMLELEYYTFTHEDGRTHITALGPYTAPAAVAEHLDMITGMHRFHVYTPKSNKLRSMGTQVDDIQYTSEGEITPDVIRERYNATTASITNQNSSHAVAEFQAQYFSPDDLTTFFQKYVPGSVDCDTVDKIVGQNDASDPSLEGSLDIQYQMGVAPCAESWFYSLKDFNFYNDLETWLTFLADTPDAPWVWSVSYGEYEQNAPSLSYQLRSDQEYMALGVRGLSIIISSGDDGVECEDQCEGMYPAYPSASVYVTSVGATKFIDAVPGPEAAVVNFKSGSGFSNALQMPDYQSDAVQAYLSSGVALPPATSYNASNRATVDISALGAEAFQVIQGGEVTAVGGTSASAPTVGGIITLLNDINFNAGRAPLGFLNYWIYQNYANTPGAFFDVTQGNDYETGSYGCTCPNGNNGFVCTKGWDLPSGVGTPNFEVLQTTLANN